MPFYILGLNKLLKLNQKYFHSVTRDKKPTGADLGFSLPVMYLEEGVERN